MAQNPGLRAGGRWGSTPTTASFTAATTTGPGSGNGDPHVEDH